jgi:hypothetical protein
MGACSRIYEARDSTLFVLLLIYWAASLIHFVHNAEFLVEYPNLPASWSRSGVYFAWMGVTVVGVTGWIFLSRGYRRMGYLILSVYAVFGLDSLGHYVLAPLSDHSTAMNSTILFEVATAILVLIEIVRQTLLRVLLRRNMLKQDA